MRIPIEKKRKIRARLANAGIGGSSNATAGGSGGRGLTSRQEVAPARPAKAQVSRAEHDDSAALLRAHGFVGASKIVNDRRLTRLRDRLNAQAARGARAEPATSRDSSFAGRARTLRLYEATHGGRDVGEAARALGFKPPNRVIADLDNIISGTPRAAWTTGKDLVKMWPEFIHHPTRETSLQREVINPTAAAYREKYGGSFGEVLHNIGEQPVSSLLDFWGGAGAAAKLGRLGTMARASGSFGDRLAAAREQTPRMFPTGRTEVELPQSPNPVAAWLQRNLVDPMSVRAQAARDQGSPIPSMFTADVRAAKQQYRDMHQDMRRTRAGAAQDLQAVKDVPRKARTGLWYDLQLPPEARGEPGLSVAAKHLRGLADEKLKAAGERVAKGKTAEREAADAKRLLNEAAKVDRAGKHTYDPEALHAADRLMADRKQILIDAGKLDPDEAGAREGLLARELGFDPSGQEVHVGHRVKQTLRSKFNLPASVEGQPRPPAGVGQQNKMLAYRSGRAITDPREVARDWEAAQAYRFNNNLRSHLGDVMNKDMAKAPPDAYIVSPDGHRLPRDQKYIDPVAKAHAEGSSVDSAMAKDIEEYVNNYVAKLDSKEGRELAEKSAKAGLNVGWVRPEVVKRLVAVKNPGGNRSLAGDVLMSTSDIVKASLIYANPGYVPANLIGNSLFAATHQGVFLPKNAARAAVRLTGAGGKGLSKTERVELRNRLRGEVGMGPTVSIMGHGRGPIHHAIQTMSRVEGFVADDWLRLSGWIHEARKAGVKTARQQLEFLRKAGEHDPEARALANKVRQRMSDAMVDFDRMGPSEREWTSRYLFVWPWIRGASRYPYTTVRDMPVRSAVGAQAAEVAANDPSMDAPPRPAWLDAAFKVGPGRFVNPRSVSTVSTFPDLFKTIVNAATGKDNASLLDIANPLIRTGADVAKGEDRFGSKLGYLGSLKAELADLSPLGSSIAELVDPSSAPKIYGPQSRLDVLKRKLGRGVIPFNIDEREAWKQARKRVDPDSRVRGDAAWLEKDYAKATAEAKLAEKLPTQVKQALAWREYRDLYRVQFKKKHGDLYDKDTGLATFTADLLGLVKAKRIPQKEAERLYQAAWAIRQHPATKARLSYMQGLLNQQAFGQAILTEFDGEIKRRGVEPPRRG